MASVLIKKAITKKVTRIETVKPALYLMQCDCCDRIFTMERLYHEHSPGYMTGIFDGCATDRNGRGLGNMFNFCVCSFKCAEELYHGGWKKLGKYKDYKRCKNEILRAEVQIGELITEEKAIKIWEGK